MKKPKILFRLKLEPVYNIIINAMVLFSIVVGLLYLFIFQERLLFIIILFILAFGLMVMKRQTHFWIRNEEIHWSFMTRIDKKFIPIDDIESILFLPNHIRIETFDYHDYAFYMDRENEKILYDYFSKKYPSIILERFTHGLDKKA